MARERRDEVGERSAGAEALANGTPDLGSELIVTDEQHPPVHDAPRRRLGHVVKERSEAKRLSARETIRERQLERLAYALGLRAEHRTEIALERNQLLEHRERVAPHVQVVVGILLDALEPLQLR